MKWIKFIPIKWLVKKLPEIIAFILTRVVKWAATKKPELLTKIVGVLERITKAMQTTLDAGADDIYTSEEVKAIARDWKAVANK